ncbi:C1 family peptidase [candidate division CSSED10-310 bacterium]|uniref:C1 family peptidase n=1 Tax=candidate division CSSED10-310 bacterium TaxID=2855610 RepID=A0ABV6Z2P1_UNCC1
MPRKHLLLFSFLLFSFIFTSFVLAASKTKEQVAQEFESLKKELEESGATYQIALNPAAYRTLDELAGLILPTHSQTARFADLPPMESLPSSWDWRSNNGVTPVKNQGSCGSCWAFSIAGAFESAILIQDNDTVDLSEQDLVNCNSYGFGCDGGYFDAFDDYVNPGAVLESCQPYTGSEGSCSTSCAHPYQISSWAYVGGDSSIPSIEQIKTAIYTHGPVAAAVTADFSMQYYSGGIFNSCNSGQPNHAIMLVGWDDNGGNGYWIMKNSWASSWGENGYMRISYNCSKIGYAACFVEYAGSGPSNSLAVSVDITHTWIGDLKVVLTTPSSQTVTLHNQTGYSADDIHTTYSVSGWDGVWQGTWTLNVADHVGQDTGTLDNWSISATPVGGSTHDASATDTPIAIPDANSNGINSNIYL